MHAGKKRAASIQHPPGSLTASTRRAAWVPSSILNGGQRLLGEGLCAQAALGQYRRPCVGTVGPGGRTVVVVVVVVGAHMHTRTEVGLTTGVRGSSGGS